MADDSTSTVVAEVVDETALKQERTSLVRGPTAVILLFVIGALGLIGVGGFWSYPTYTTLQGLQDERDALFARTDEKKAELRDLKKRNENAAPSEVEQSFAKKIPLKNEPSRTIRDIVDLVQVDASTPDDDLSLVSFTIEPGVKRGEYVVVAINLSLKGTRAGLTRFLEIAGDVDSGRRFAIPTTATVTYSANAVSDSDLSGSPADVRFAYLLRQEARHLLTQKDREELEIGKAIRIAQISELRAKRDLALNAIRAFERKEFLGSSRERSEELATLVGRVNEYESLYSDAIDRYGDFQYEVSSTVRLEMYYETDPNAKDEKPTNDKKAPPKST